MCRLGNLVALTDEDGGGGECGGDSVPVHRFMMYIGCRSTQSSDGGAGDA